MKNVILRGDTYYFRIGVPKDCRESVGKSEITQSLKTKEAIEAAALAKGFTADWKRKFKEIRNTSLSAPPVVMSRTNDTVEDFRKSLASHMERNLPGFLEKQSDESLEECSRYYFDAIAVIGKNGNGSYDFLDELGVSYPLPEQTSPGMTRKLNKVLAGLLGEMRRAIDKEIGRNLSQEIDEEILGAYPEVAVPMEPATGSSVQGETDILQITKLMLDAKGIDGSFGDLIQCEIEFLREWSGGKADITTYTKGDLVDYARNCLPHIPKNMRQGDEYDGKSLKECVKMTKSNPDKHVPIAHRTCENRFAGMTMVFNYAKEYLGIVPVNLAKGIQIPKVRALPSKPRGYTGDELSKMWEALLLVSETMDKRPERYWIPIIGLYHGFRLNEMCSLHLRDVYRHADGTYVIDINDNGKNKSVKNKSSVRIVPVHPFVLKSLGFEGFVENRKASGSKDDLLFTNLTFTEDQGYGKKMSVWYRKWKKKWLPTPSLHKNFHDLRYTFTQQAQNQAKMPDRCSQEITGHSIGGVSSIHLGYSGRLKPKDVLEELKKVQYGWE